MVRRVACNATAASRLLSSRTVHSTQYLQSAAKLCSNHQLVTRDTSAMMRHWQHMLRIEFLLRRSFSSCFSRSCKGPPVQPASGTRLKQSRDGRHLVHPSEAMLWLAVPHWLLQSEADWAAAADGVWHRATRTVTPYNGKESAVEQAAYRCNDRGSVSNDARCCQEFIELFCGCYISGVNAGWRTFLCSSRLTMRFIICAAYFCNLPRTPQSTPTMN